MKTDLEKFKELYSSVGIAFEIKKDDGEIYLRIFEPLCHNNIVFDADEKFKYQFVTDY